MVLIIQYGDKTQEFEKETIKIGSSNDSDFVLNFENESSIILQYNEKQGAFILVNSSMTNVFKIGEKPLPKKSLLRKSCKISVADKQEQLILKVGEAAKTSQTEFESEDIYQQEENEIENSASNILTEPTEPFDPSAANVLSATVDQPEIPNTVISDFQTALNKEIKDSSLFNRIILKLFSAAIILILFIAAFFGLKSFSSKTQTKQIKKVSAIEKFTETMLKNTQIKGFDYRVGANGVADGLKELIPTDIPKGNAQFIIDIITQNSIIIGKLIKDNSDLNISAYQAYEIMGIIGGATYKKGIELCYSKIPQMYWNDILLNVSLDNFSVEKHGLKLNLPQEQINEMLKESTEKSYNEAIDTLLKENKISEEIAAKAKKIEGINYFAE